jgi:transposase
VLAGLRGDRSVRDLCREYQIAETLFYQWRERRLDGGKAASANPRDKTPEQTEIDHLKRKVGQLEQALGRKTYEPGGRGELSRALLHLCGRRRRRVPEWRLVPHGGVAKRLMPPM